MTSEDEAVPGIDIIDISMFRLRLSANLRSNLMSDLHQVCPTDGLGLDAAEWSTIPEATESHVTLDAGLIQHRIFCGKFEERNAFNIPGPFYGAQTDTCETGPLEAPENVMLDGDWQEFVFRQPTTAEELRRVIGAARCDPFLGYGADGDQHWNLRLIREWWRGLEGRMAQSGELAVTNPNTEQRVSFSTSQAEIYLRRYAFFVDNRRLPTPTDHLPDL
ncbi:MAG: hypothetical protein NTZ32_05670 [Planctomycetales bacterium]|nr:hypothetical protein [Planctomycetales bacterium]